VLNPAWSLTDEDIPSGKISLIFSFRRLSGTYMYRCIRVLFSLILSSHTECWMRADTVSFSFVLV
jgi:hypothetical protein